MPSYPALNDKEFNLLKKIAENTADIAAGGGGGGGAVSSVNGQTGVVVLTKSSIGLGNADNTSDANKPVSTAQATAIALKANIASPTFTGTPSAPTAAPGTNTTQLATTAFVIANSGTPAGTIIIGPNYVTFTVGDPDTSPVTDGHILRAAYAAAKALTPNGGSPGPDNRSLVLIPPGYYQTDEEFLVDGEYVDLISLTGDPKDVVIFLTETDIFDGAVKQTAADVRYKGITFLSERARGSGDSSEPAAWFPDPQSYNDTLFTDCVFRDGGFLQPLNTGWCMRQGVSVLPTFINCVSGDNSFGSNLGKFSGSAYNCQAGSQSFGSGGGVSPGDGGNFEGEARDCKAGSESFGGGSSGYVECSGNLYRCTAGGSYSFGTTVFSGYAEDCQVTGSGSDSFGGTAGTFSGTAKRCSSGNFSFGGDLIQGGATLADCVAGNGSFGTTSIGSGCRLTNCFAGNDSFAGSGHIFDGSSFIGCTAGTTSFGDEAESSTVFTNCSAATNSFGTSLFSAKCINCTAAGSGSFGGQGTFDGELVDCSLIALTTPWAPPTSMAGSISRVTFWQFGTDQDAVTICNGTTTSFQFCTFRKNGTAFPMGITAASSATPKISYCSFNDPSALETGITNALGATLADAFNIGNALV